MRVQFWGTRGSIAKPGPSTARYGGNTSCIEVRSARGTLVIIDCGTGGHWLGQNLIAAGDEAGAADLTGKVFGTRGGVNFLELIKSGAIDLQSLSTSLRAT